VVMSANAAAPARVMDPGNPGEALRAAVEAAGWRGGPIGDSWTRLAGASTATPVAWLVTDLRGVPGAMSVETMLPISLPARTRIEAAELCAAVNRSATDGVAGVSSDGTPLVCSKAALWSSPQLDAAALVETVDRNRRLAFALTESFRRIADGESADEVTADLNGDPRTGSGTGRCGSPLDLSGAAEPSERAVEGFAALGFGPREASSLLRLQALLAAAIGRPICAGPVVTHEDGVAECYGCDGTPGRAHVENVTVSCGPMRSLGPGHRCARCAP
jgi:hypothetical protein